MRLSVSDTATMNSSPSPGDRSSYQKAARQGLVANRSLLLALGERDEVLLIFAQGGSDGLFTMSDMLRRTVAALILSA
jgi:hypothetical protein